VAGQRPVGRRRAGPADAAGYLLGGLLPAALVSSITATGGVLLLGVGLRLLALKLVAVGDLLPALVAAPLLVLLADAVR
jgi:uncharacterized membrane protein YqgA involved in biofilm formation